MSNILIVDDEKNILSSFNKFLQQEGYQVLTAKSAEEAFQVLSRESLDLVIMDIRMPGMTGLEAISRFKQSYPKLPVILMTAFGTVDTAIEAMKAGAYEYLIKPFDIPEMKDLVRKALEVSRLMKVEVGYEKEKVFEGDKIVGNSAAMQKVYKLIGQVAESDVNILLRGESGVGKELIARAVYFHSKLKDKPFIVLNSAAIPDALLESELFGHEKGAFTDAQARRVGRLEQCHGGTLFLDEIGDMSSAIQAKILRVLENKSFERLGGNNTVKADVRIITATNKNLEALVREGRFREDLFYRLNAVTITVPPLRERKEDIAVLVDYFLKKYSHEFGKDIKEISKEALGVLGEYLWPGNVRELENVIKKAVLLGKGRVLLPGHLFIPGASDAPPTIKKEFDRALSALVHARKTLSPASLYAEVIEEVEKVLVVEALKQTDGNQSQACKILGLSRPTLKDRIEKLGLKKHFEIQEG
jgi:nitrogen regulation protein NR(I)